MSHQEGSANARSEEHVSRQRRWWQPQPTVFPQPQEPFSGLWRFGPLPLKTLARIPPEQYPEMFLDAQAYTGKHWLPLTCAACFGLLGLVFFIFPEAKVWSLLAMIVAPSSLIATQRVIMQSYLEGRLRGVT